MIKKRIKCCMCGKYTDNVFGSYDKKNNVCCDCICEMYRYLYCERLKVEEEFEKDIKNGYIYG